VRVETITNWEVQRFSHVLKVRDGLVNPESAVYIDFPLIAPNHIESGTGRILGLETARDQGASSGKVLACAGDVIYSKIRPGLNKVTIAPTDCLCSADMYAIRPSARINSRYLMYQILAKPFLDFATVQSMRVAMPKINREALGGAPLLVPPLTMQERVAEFLDRETAKIDALIAKQGELLVSLAEHRRSIIESALASLPGERVPLKRLYRQSSLCEAPDSEVLSVYRDHGVIPKASRSDNFNKTPENLDRYLVVRLGDLVVNKMKAWQGSLGVSSYEGIVSPDYEVLNSMSPERFRPDFAHWLLRSPAMIGQYRSRSVGIRPAQWRLYWQELGNVEVVVPTPERQVASVGLLRAEMSQIAVLFERVRDLIAVMKERRSALISAAVTGELDVTAYGR